MFSRCAKIIIYYLTLKYVGEALLVSLLHVHVHTYACKFTCIMIILLIYYIYVYIVYNYNEVHVKILDTKFQTIVCALISIDQLQVMIKLFIHINFTTNNDLNVYSSNE